MLLMALVLEVVLQCLPVSSGLRLDQSSPSMPLSRYMPGQHYVYSYGWALSNARRGVTNRQGFANSADFQPDAAVLVLGDSFVESLMLDYPDTLQGALDSMLGGAVYSAASSGNGLADTLELLRYYAPRLHPRNVVVLIDSGNLNNLLLPASRSHNQFVAGPDGVRTVHVEYVESKLKRWMAHSALVRYAYYNLKLPDWISSLLRVAPMTGGFNAAPAARDQMLDYYFRQIKAVQGVANMKIVFVIDGERNTLYEPKKGKPTWHGDDRQVFMAQVRRNGHTVVDMQPVFEEHWRQRGERLDFLPMDGHWNKVAHGMAAQQVRQVLLPATQP
ncbi:hypothetical protein [Janthinobacterium lividum]|uniref:AlgX/AlgJ SGNH hydrolase-like domain-containing protein n=1 Tax=Janthinobacterium lividum TaxID=29581 RepID=A0A1E8PNW6_9BURK|nr:hypothetical protein BA896_002465 [Janthinobacterium lividum]